MKRTILLLLSLVFLVNSIPVYAAGNLNDGVGELAVIIDPVTGPTHHGNEIIFSVSIYGGSAPYDIWYYIEESSATVYGEPECENAVSYEDVWTFRYIPRDPDLDVTFTVDIFDANGAETDMDSPTVTVYSQASENKTESGSSSNVSVILDSLRTEQFIRTDIYKNTFNTTVTVTPWISGENPGFLHQAWSLLGQTEPLPELSEWGLEQNENGEFYVFQEGPFDRMWYLLGVMTMENVTEGKRFSVSSPGKSWIQFVPYINAIVPTELLAYGKFYWPNDISATNGGPVISQNFPVESDVWGPYAFVLAVPDASYTDFAEKKIKKSCLSFDGDYSMETLGLLEANSGSAPGVVPAYLDMTFSANRVFTVGEPVAVDVDIRNGTAPYQITIYWSALNDDGLWTEDLAVDSFVTSDRNFSRQLVPRTSARMIGVQVYAADAAGMEMLYFDEPYMWEIKRSDSREIFYSRMAEVFSNVKGPDRLEGSQYYQSLPENAGWYARFLELLTGMSNPFEVLKNAVETATEGDKKKFLIDNAIAISATPDTYQLPKWQDLPKELQNVIDASKLAEPVYLDSCTLWLFENAQIDIAQNTELYEYVRGGVSKIFQLSDFSFDSDPNLKYLLKSSGFSSRKIHEMMWGFKILKTYSFILKFFETAEKTYRSVSDVWNQMALAASLDEVQLYYLADAYRSQGYDVGDLLTMLLNASEEDRPAIILSNSLLSLTLDGFLNAGDIGLFFSDNGAFAAIGGFSYAAEFLFGASSVPKTLYQLGHSKELTEIAWRDFRKYRDAFLMDQNISTFAGAYYAMQNYYRSASITENAFVSVVKAGQNTAASAIMDLGFGSEMSTASQRSLRNANWLESNALQMRQIYEEWYYTDYHISDTLLDLVDDLESMQ